MKNYEVMYIVNANLDEAARVETINAMHAIITNNGGKIDNVNEWGLRDLAYEIDDHTKGYYVVTEFTADNTALNEFERLMRINNNIIRHLTINLEEKN